MADSPGMLTMDGFLAWQARQDRLFEFVDGQPVAMAGAKLRHDRITTNAIRTIGTLFRSSGNPCDVFSADIGVRTSPHRLRRPDATVLCPPFNEDATATDQPRLVLEVLSEGTEKVDRLVKIGEYQGLASLDHILMVEPASVEVGIWHRDAGGGWGSRVVRDLGALVDLPALGIVLPVSALYDRVTLDTAPGGPRLVWDGGPAPGATEG